MQLLFVVFKASKWHLKTQHQRFFSETISQFLKIIDKPHSGGAATCNTTFQQIKVKISAWLDSIRGKWENTIYQCIGYICRISCNQILYMFGSLNIMQSSYSYLQSTNFNISLRKTGFTAELLDWFNPLCNLAVLY